MLRGGGGGVGSCMAAVVKRRALHSSGVCTPLCRPLNARIVGNILLRA